MCRYQTRWSFAKSELLGLYLSQLRLSRNMSLGKCPSYEFSQAFAGYQIAAGFPMDNAISNELFIPETKELTTDILSTFPLINTLHVHKCIIIRRTMSGWQICWNCHIYLSSYTCHWTSYQSIQQRANEFSIALFFYVGVLRPLWMQKPGNGLFVWRSGIWSRSRYLFHNCLT